MHIFPPGVGGVCWGVIVSPVRMFIVSLFRAQSSIPCAAIFAGVQVVLGLSIWVLLWWRWHFVISPTALLLPPLDGFIFVTYNMCGPGGSSPVAGSDITDVMTCKEATMLLRVRAILTEAFVSDRGQTYWRGVDLDTGGDVKFVTEDGVAGDVPLLVPVTLDLEARGRSFGKNYALFASKLVVGKS